MYWIRFAILLPTAAVLQVALGAGLALTKARIQFDIPLILMSYFAANALIPDAVIACFAVGLVADLIGWTLGPQMLAFGLCGTMISYIKRFVMLHRPVQMAILICMAGAATGLLARILSAIKGVPVPLPAVNHVLLDPIYSAIIGPVLVIPLEKIMRLRDKRYRMGLR